MLLWDRVLSDNEIAQISANPWQVFRAPYRIPLVAAPSSSSGSANGATVTAIASAISGAATGAAAAAGQTLSTVASVLAGTAGGEGPGARIGWAHLDLAGPAYHAGSPYGGTGRGPTGVAVRTMLALTADLADA